MAYFFFFSLVTVRFWKTLRKTAARGRQTGNGKLWIDALSRRCYFKSIVPLIQHFTFRDEDTDTAIVRIISDESLGFKTQQGGKNMVRAFLFVLGFLIKLLQSAWGLA